MRPTMAWGFPPGKARERWRRRSRRQTRASWRGGRHQATITRGLAEYPARLAHATNARFASDSGRVPGTAVPPSHRVRRNGIARGGGMVP